MDIKYHSRYVDQNMLAQRFDETILGVQYYGLITINEVVKKIAKVMDQS